MNLRVLELAENELIEAAKWYAARQAGLGDELIAEFHRSLQEIETNPFGFGHLETVPQKYEIRRCILKRFPYLIVYEIRKEEEIVVLSFAHASRKPNYWRKRQKG